MLFITATYRCAGCFSFFSNHPMDINRKVYCKSCRDTMELVSVSTEPYVDKGKKSGINTAGRTLLRKIAVV